METFEIAERHLEQQPLIKQGVILLNEDITSAAYEMMCWSLVAARQVQGDRPILLQCNGDGGSSGNGLAIVDLIQRDGYVWGIALGRVCSSTATIWASCARRFIGNYAEISVHTVGKVGIEYPVNQQYFEHEAAIYGWTNRMFATIYAQASNKDEAWWLEQMNRAGLSVTPFDAHAVIHDLQMASPLAALTS